MKRCGYSESFMQRIKAAYFERRDWYEYGRYTYKFDPNTGDIYRCLTDVLGWEWIDKQGYYKSGWEYMCNVCDCYDR